MKRLASVLLSATLLFNLTACGYFLYPERVGRESGRIDATVVLLDAAGLLFGIIPGVVAFAVDFSTGAIYLAPGESSSVEKHTHNTEQSFGSELNLEVVDEQQLSVDRDKLAQRLQQEFGLQVNPADIALYQSRQSTTLALHPVDSIKSI